MNKYELITTNSFKRDYKKIIKKLSKEIMMFLCSVKLLICFLKMSLFRRKTAIMHWPAIGRVIGNVTYFPIGC